MSRDDVDNFFSNLPVWMKNDIRREIQLAHASATADGRAALGKLGIEPGGGNLLAALGLVSYTEALGRIRRFNEHLPHSDPQACFLAFFDKMAIPSYCNWRLDWESKYDISLYEALRCGLVHEYQPKVDSAFWIGSGDALGLADEKGVLTFKAEPYLRHFAEAADALHRELLALDDPRIPPPQRRQPVSVRLADGTHPVSSSDPGTGFSVRRTS